MNKVNPELNDEEVLREIIREEVEKGILASHLDMYEYKIFSGREYLLKENELGWRKLATDIQDIVICRRVKE